MRSLCITVVVDGVGLCRGYRDAMHAAALRETLASGLLLLSGYDPSRHVLCDPMAGSGTIAIEAALMARDIAPGLLR